MKKSTQKMVGIAALLLLIGSVLYMYGKGPKKITVAAMQEKKPLPATFETKPTVEGTVTKYYQEGKTYMKHLVGSMIKSKPVAISEEEYTSEYYKM